MRRPRAAIALAVAILAAATAGGLLIAACGGSSDSTGSAQTAAAGGPAGGQPPGERNHREAPRAHRRGNRGVDGSAEHLPAVDDQARQPASGPHVDDSGRRPAAQAYPAVIEGQARLRPR